MSGTQLDPSIITNGMAGASQSAAPVIQQWLAAKSQMLQNQQQQAQQAAGRDFQSAFNPVTGKTDYGKFNALLAGDRGAAMYAQDASQKALTNQTTAQTNQGNDITLYQARTNAFAGALEGLKSKGSFSRGDVMDAVASLPVSLGIPASVKAGIVASYDPNNPQAWLAQKETELNAQASALADRMPKMLPVDTGGNTTLNAVDQITGQPTPVAAYQNTLSPRDAATPITVQEAGGAQQEPLGAYARQTGNGNLLTGAGGGLGTGRAPQTMNGNAITGAGMPGQQPPQTGTGPAPSWQGFAFPSWAKLGNAYIPAGLADEQAAGADLYKADVSKVSNAAQQVNQLQSIISESANANTGALAGFFESAGSTAQQLGLTNSQQATDLQLVQKNVSQLVTSQLGTIGAPTDAKMNEAIYGTPNATMTPEAIKGAGAQLIGAIKWKQAEMQAFQNYQQAAGQAGYPVSAGAYAQFNAQWQKQVPVAAFQLQSMPPSLRAQYLKSIGKDQARAIYQAATSGPTP